MVKCPRGTSSQVKANWLHFNEQSGGLNLWTYDSEKGEAESQTLIAESENTELDSVRADKRCAPTARDELVYFFISYFLDILKERWESKPYKKRKLGARAFAVDESYETDENFGEDLGSCEEYGVFSTVDFLKNLYKKRSSNLSKENLKKDSESSESEYLNEVDLEIPEYEESTESVVADEEVHFTLLNGVWYKGRVSRKLMEGDGMYFWEDGSSYQGDFVGGYATGKGRLEFSNMTVYEGSVYKAFRHGEGMCCFLDSSVMYSGQWWLGKKHGQGLIVYNDPTESQNFYRGQWQDGYKEGFGFRQYPSGAKYVGFWSNGRRHGKGVMLWNNNDIYKGQWKDGLMHGFGEYTWNGFVNKSLSYPITNTYRGQWSGGNRNGCGVLECKNGALIETFWNDNVKSGAGTVICCNGAVITSDHLFEKDKQAPFNDQEDKLGLLVGESLRPKHEVGKPGEIYSDEEREQIIAHLWSVERAKAKSIPIFSPPEMLNLDIHTQKYSIQRKMHMKRRVPDPGSDFELAGLESETDAVHWDKLPEAPDTAKFDSTGVELSERKFTGHNQLLECTAQEQKELRNYIIMKITALKTCYEHYATLACDKQPPFQCILLRLFLWQLLIEAEIPSSDLSLVDIDLMMAEEKSLLLLNPHDPFGKIYFWQFLHILISLAWHLYGQHVLRDESFIETERTNKFLKYFDNSKTNTVLKTAFQYLLENNVLREKFGPNFDSFSDGKTGFEKSDYAPMEAMYQVYRKVGEPHTARDFLNVVCCKADKDKQPTIVRYFEKLPYYKIDGRNILTVAGELLHLPGPEPFNHPQLFALEASFSNSELTCFNGMKATNVLKCLIQVCPDIMSDGSIVNMDYKLTFLEFYKAIILCTESQLKISAMKEIRSELIKNYKIQIEEYEKQMAEYERRHEVRASGKKSRQLSEASKKTRKNGNNE